MDSNSNKFNNDEKNQANFFQFTRHQLSVNLEKYDKVIKGNPVSLFNTNTISEENLKDKPVFQKRLNSLDSAMIEDAAYLVIDDPDLKLEKKIEDTEKALKEVKEKLIVADTIKDERAKAELSKQKKFLSQKLQNLKIQYNSQNAETHLTSIIARCITLPDKIRKKFKKNIKKFLIHSKFIRQFTPIVKALMVRDTLGRLNKINKSVDELVKMHIPFGEQEQRYETLVTHLSKAGALHSQILKELKG